VVGDVACTHTPITDHPLSSASGISLLLPPRLLASRRIDCFASDRAAALRAARQLETYFAASGFKLLEAVELSGEDTFIGCSGKNNPAYKADFIAKMDAALETMKRNGQLTKIVDEYLR
jgi:polar amino acid transport system substrate-binding protein